MTCRKGCRFEVDIILLHFFFNDNPAVVALHNCVAIYRTFRRPRHKGTARSLCSSQRRTSLMSEQYRAIASARREKLLFAARCVPSQMQLMPMRLTLLFPTSTSLSTLNRSYSQFLLAAYLFRYATPRSTEARHTLVRARHVNFTLNSLVGHKLSQTPLNY